MMKYVVAVRRDRRESAPPDLLAEIAKQQGIDLVGSIQFGRMVIECDDPAIDHIRAEYGQLLHIEPMMTYRPSKEP